MCVCGEEALNSLLRWGSPSGDSPITKHSSQGGLKEKVELLGQGKENPQILWLWSAFGQGLLLPDEGC